MEKRRRHRYLVMPGRGISGSAMQSSIFRGGSAGSLSHLAIEQLNAIGLQTRATGAVTAMSGGAELGADLRNEDFRVLSQRFEDGPATVLMTHWARLVLEAANPDLRVLPITRYDLPGRRRPSRGKLRAYPATSSSEDAGDGRGNVFENDAKSHFMRDLAGGGEGRGVLIGVLDTGIDSTHPALEGKVLTSRCLIAGADPTSGRPVDYGNADDGSSGHGTHVAGIIAAAAGHGGPAGLAPESRLISYRVFPDSSRGRSTAANAVIIDSIRAAIDDGCHIINLSLEGATLREDGVRSAIADAWENGVLCIAAAGNGFGNPVSYPAAIQHCIAVTAIGRDGAFPDREQHRRFVSDQRSTVDPAIFLASFSNFGPQVQFAAPGHAIVSTFPGRRWWFSSGTSMAAPFVSGVMARLLSDNPRILDRFGGAERSSAMLQLLLGHARLLGMPQPSQEGYGLPFTR